MVLADAEDEPLVDPRELCRIAEGYAACAVIVKAGDRPERRDLYHRVDVRDVAEPQLVFACPTVVVGKQKKLCFGIFFGQSRNEGVERSVKRRNVAV